jgi:hypothetical protein
MKKFFGGMAYPVLAFLVQLGRARRLVAIAVVLSACSAALAGVANASTLNNVVPITGTVAGQPYRYWMTRLWEPYFTSARPKPCATAHVGGRTVTLVENFHGGNSTCHVPAGQPIYINEYTTHCSTIPGDHQGFGTSAFDVQTCSYGIHRSTTKVLISVWLDGQNVPRFGNDLWKGTNAFSVNLASDRFKGVAQRRVQAAAWGWTLLLRGLPKGTHTVFCRVLYPDRRVKAQSTVTLRVR